MKLQVIFLFCTLISGMATAQNDLKVVISDIREAEGQLILALYDNDETFMGDNPVKYEYVKAENGEVSVSFKGLKQGVYALSVIHDRNQNNELDKNLLGIPKEPFGFSNNVMGTFGAPSFQDASVEVADKPVEITIKLKRM